MRMNLLGQSHKHKPLNTTTMESSTDASQASSAYQFDEFDLSGRRGAYILSDSESQSQCPERKTNESCSKKGNDKKKVPKKRKKRPLPFREMTSDEVLERLHLTSLWKIVTLTLRVIKRQEVSPTYLGVGDERTYMTKLFLGNDTTTKVELQHWHHTNIESELQNLSIYQTYTFHNVKVWNPGRHAHHNSGNVPYTLSWKRGLSSAVKCRVDDNESESSTDEGEEAEADDWIVEDEQEEEITDDGEEEVDTDSDSENDEVEDEDKERGTITLSSTNSSQSTTATAPISDGEDEKTDKSEGIKENVKGSKKTRAHYADDIFCENSQEARK